MTLAAHAAQDPNAGADLDSFAIQHQELGFQQGYYHGLAEYQAALTGQPVYTPEENAAYQQGIADYQALVYGQG